MTSPSRIKFNGGVDRNYRTLPDTMHVEGQMNFLKLLPSYQNTRLIERDCVNGGHRRFSIHLYAQIRIEIL